MTQRSSDREAIEAEIDRIRSLGLDDLRTLWRTTFRSSPLKGCYSACNFDPWTENIGSRAFELSLPRRDLIGVDVELLRELRQRPIALDRRKRHLRLEGRCVVPARSSPRGLS